MNTDDLATAYEWFVKPGMNLLGDTGFPVTPGLRTAVLATGWAERQYVSRYPKDLAYGFWSISTHTISCARSRYLLEREALMRVCAVLAIPDIRQSTSVKLACQWNDLLASAVCALALSPALPRHPSEPWSDLNAARKLSWGMERPPVDKDLWFAAARIAAA